MKIRRKVNNCLNCHALLDDVYNYCPMCGQENNDNNVSVGTLVHDFFSNYFAFDSKLYNTIVPFFIKPGYITNRYIAGKRVSYAHPLRMYLIISLFYFFIWSVLTTDLVMEATENSGNNTNQGTSLKDDEFSNLDSAAVNSVRSNLPPGTLDRMDSALEANESLEFGRAFSRYTTRQQKQEVANTITRMVVDSTVNNLPVRPKITISPGSDSFSVENDSTEADDFVLFRMDYDRMNEIGKDRTLTDQQVLDSLNMGTLSQSETQLAKQMIRITRADKESLAGYVVKNLPIMMLILIPFFALILKLLYIRRPFLYINHIIHGLHLHSFAYLFYGMTLVITYFIIESESASNWINMLSFFLVSTYAYISFLRVYRQGWFKTVVKFNLAGFMYCTLILTFFLLELMVSFYFY